MPIETINWVFALGAIAAQIAGAVFLLVYLLRARVATFGDIASFAGRLGLWVGFLLSVIGVVLTLFYSEVVGYVPCGLCWMVRIFLYPQVILFAMALWKRDSSIADYSLGLSVPGIFVALYTHYIQMGGAELVPCPSSGVSDCARRLVFEFGYVTMPIMGATLFALLILGMLFVRAARR